MAARSITPVMLMDLSVSRLESLRYSGNADERRVVTRLYDQPSAYRCWGSFHYQLMQKVAATRSRQDQLLRLRRTSLSLLHRQALFEYLRTSRVTGRDRQALFSAFYGATAYERAVINEHGRYLQSNSSLYCTDHLEQGVLQDVLFADGLPGYRDQYMEYFSLFCDWIVAERRGVSGATHAMVPELKSELSIAASRLLALPVQQVERRSARRAREFGLLSARPQSAQKRHRVGASFQLFDQR